MLSSILTLAFVVAGVTAKNSTLPDGFNPGLVETGTRTDWCIAQRNACPKICGGSTKENDCTVADLSYSCICENGKTPDVADYKSTLPYFVCQENFGQCIANNAQDSEAQDECKDARKKCGSKDPEDAAVDDDEDDDESSSSATPTGTSKPTSTEDASPTADSTPTPTDNAATAQTYSMGVIAVAFVGAFGLLA